MKKETTMNDPKRKTTKGTPIVLGFVLALLVIGGGIGLVNHFIGRPPVKPQVKKTIYTCVMHHQIRRDEPGDCPICGMKLVPLDQIQGGLGTPAPVSVGQALKKAEGITGTSEGTSLSGLAPVQLSPYKQQLIGVRLATVKKVPITRVIHTNGRFAGGAGDFASLAGDFAARNPLRVSGRYVVADVYALDFPFVKAGEKAVVTTLSGSGTPLEGKVAQIYPNDETQSRVTRVRINLAQAPSRELFANVDIEATTEPRLAVPPTAVMDTGNHRYVFLQGSEGTFLPKEISIGFQGGDLWEVTAGLKEGDKVVDGANFMIDADSKLKAAFAEGQ
jgi:hypothetical protein